MAPGLEAAGNLERPDGSLLGIFDGNLDLSDIFWLIFQHKYKIKFNMASYKLVRDHRHLTTAKNKLRTSSNRTADFPRRAKFHAHQFTTMFIVVEMVTLQNGTYNLYWKITKSTGI